VAIKTKGMNTIMAIWLAFSEPTAVLSINCPPTINADNRWVIVQYSDGTQRLIYLEEGANQVSVSTKWREKFSLQIAHGYAVCQGSDDVSGCSITLLPIEYDLNLETAPCGKK
jgi:hypothetical protein